MNNVIRYWDNNLVSAHIGTELSWLYNYLDKNNFNSVSFIDIGGNVGKFYDEISKKYDVKKCVVVEPSKTLFNYLSEKFLHNDSITLFNFAISDENGSFDFVDSAEQVVDYFKDSGDNNSINLGLSKLKKINGGIKSDTM
jgi:pantothenate kinase